MYHFFVETTGNPHFLVLAHDAEYAIMWLVKYMRQNEYNTDWLESWENATPEHLPFKYRMQIKVNGGVVEIENC